MIQWTTESPLLNCANALSQDPADSARTLDIGRQALMAKLTALKATQMESITSLYALAQKRGMNPKELAAALGVGMPIIAKLQQRLLLISSIPGHFIERLATELQVGVDQIRAYLAQPPGLAASALYKSDGVPQIGAQEEFAQAIRTCPGMTQEQKQAWLSLKAEVL